MLRIFVGLVAVWVFAGGFGGPLSSACENALSPQRDCKPCKRPDGTLNHSPNVTDLILDKTQLRLKDPTPGTPQDEPARSDELMINVATHAEDAENDVLDYYYVISGGHIVGSGSNVQWDLNGVPPGTYTITARVDDSCGVCGKTITKGVMIIGKTPVIAATPAAAPVTRPAVPANSSTSPAITKAPTSVVITRPAPSTAIRNAPPSTPNSSVAVTCSCPKIMIADPERSDTDLIFTTKIFDLTATNRLTYIWTITGGSVVSQDGRSIRIKPGVLGGSVNVTVNGFDPKCGCANTAQVKF